MLPPNRKSPILLLAAFTLLLGTAGCNQQQPQAQAPKAAEPVAGQRTSEDDEPDRQPTTHAKAGEIQALDAEIDKKPEDMFLRNKMLIFLVNDGDRAVGKEAATALRRKHILWLIEHHPEAKVSRTYGARIGTAPDDLDPDPEGYEMGRKLWLKNTEKPDTKPSLLNGAARFLRINDKPLAEGLYLRAQAREPQGRWATELGHLYFEVLVGATSFTPVGQVRTVSIPESHSAFAREIRKKLAASTQPAILITAAEPLGTVGARFADQHQVDFDAGALAREYISKALQMDPNSELAHQVSNVIRFQERGAQLTTIPQGSTPEAQFAALAGVPEPHRAIRLALLGTGAYSWGEAAAKNDPQAARAARETARKSAFEALRLAGKFPSDAETGTAIFNANMALGLVALAEGNRGDAVKFMLTASHAPASEELEYSPNEFTLKLPQLLYEEGERNSVAEFLEQFAQVNESERGFLQESAKAIRKGGKPLWILNNAKK